MSKFKDCFTSKLPNYRYDIVIDGEKFGTAHLLNAADQAYIEANCISKKLVNGELQIDIQSHKNMTATIYKALESWELGVPITFEAIDDLTAPLRLAVFTQIQDHEAEQSAVIEDNEKN